MAHSPEQTPETIAGVYRKVVPGDWAWEHDRISSVLSDQVSPVFSNDLRTHLVLPQEMKNVAKREEDSWRAAVDEIRQGEISELVSEIDLTLKALVVVTPRNKKGKRIGNARLEAYFEHSEEWLEARARVIELLPWRRGRAPAVRDEAGRQPAYMLLARGIAAGNSRQIQSRYQTVFPRSARLRLEPTKVKLRPLSEDELVRRRQRQQERQP